MSRISRATIENALVSWLSTEMSAVTVILAEQGAPKPGSPFATIKLSGARGQGLDDRLDITDPGAPAYATQDLLGDRRAPVSVQLFGAGALDYARQAADSLNLQTVRDALWAAGLAPVLPPGEVRDLTGLVQTDFEERAQFDFDLVWGDSYTDTIPLIERVTGSGTVTGAEDRPVTFDSADGA